MKIFCVSDLHFREDIPSCRDKDFLEAQERKLCFLFELFHKWGGDVIIDAGDFFHKNKVSVKFVNYLINIFKEYDINKDNYFLLLGNHDMPGYLKKEDTAAYTFYLSGVVNILDEDSKVTEFPLFKTPIKNVFIMHQYIYRDGEIKGIIEGGYSAKELLSACPEKSLVISGHSHHHFYTKWKTSYLLNPGGMTRQRQNDGERGFFVFDTDTLRVRDIFYPYWGKVYSTVLGDDIQKLKENETFVDNLLNVERSCFSFRENVEYILQEREVGEELKNRIYSILKEEI